MFGPTNLSRVFNALIKRFYNTNRAFLAFVVRPDGEIEVHTNMDRNNERVKMLEIMTQRMKQL